MRWWRGVVAVGALGSGLLAGAGPAEGATEPEAAFTGVVQVSGGLFHTCAALASGQAACWGDGGNGRLGNNSTAPQSNPVTVLNPAGDGPLTGVAQVTAASAHSCARLTSGQVRCWGGNASGQLGIGTVTPSALPVVVRNPANDGPLTGVTQLTSGPGYNCARLATTEVVCWGNNAFGQLGNGTVTSPQPLPTAVLAPTGAGNLTQVTQVSTAGGGGTLAIHTCARLSTGQARCWGSGANNQLGDGDATQRLRPVVVDSVSGAGALTGVTQVVVGERHSCARLTSGQARCWGNNTYGQLGDTTGNPRPRPVAVRKPAGAGALGTVTHLAAGTFHTCARLSTGQVRCWGNGGSGRLGNGLTDSRFRPVTVKAPTGTGPLTGVSTLTGGAGHTCARLSTGQARCWGDNFIGQVGDGTETDRLRPVPVRT